MLSVKKLDENSVYIEFIGNTGFGFAMLTDSIQKLYDCNDKEICFDSGREVKILEEVFRFCFPDFVIIDIDKKELKIALKKVKS
jgi:hypothetical protein